MSTSDLLLQWINKYSCHLMGLTVPSGNCFRIEITHLKGIYIWDFKRYTRIILHKRFTYLYSQQQWVRTFGPHTFINTACNHICIWNIYTQSYISMWKVKNGFPVFWRSFSHGLAIVGAKGRLLQYVPLWHDYVEMKISKALKTHTQKEPLTFLLTALKWFKWRTCSRKKATITDNYRIPCTGGGSREN